MRPRPPGMLAGMGATQSVGSRLASGTRPGEALEAGPEGAPEARGSLGDDEGDAAGVEQDAAAAAQHGLAEAAQAPAGISPLTKSPWLDSVRSRTRVAGVAWRW